MPNGLQHAKRWTEFLAARPEIRNARRLLEHFKAGNITRFCDCGCHGFDIDVPPDANVVPLIEVKSGGGAVLTMDFHTTRTDSFDVSFVIFVDGRGMLDGIDISHSANVFPMPDELELLEPPFHVDGRLAA